MNIAYFTYQTKNLSPINRYSSQKPMSYNAFASKIGIRSDTFTKNPSFTAKPFTIDWYKTLTPDKINIINQRADKYIYHNKDWLFYDKNFNKHLHYHNIIETGIKYNLNDKFGAGNYIIIPIGRSVASIGKCLGYKIGEDNVRFLPMSSAGRFLELKKCDEDFDLFNQYINSIGLSKEKVKKSKKHYIFMDFANTGRSIKGIKTLFESDKVWNEHFDNVHFENIFNLLPEIKSEQVREELFYGKTFAEDLKSMFMYSQFKKYSPVKDCPRFDCLSRAVIEPEKYNLDQQVFYWKLLDNEIKNNWKVIDR